MSFTTCHLFRLVQLKAISISTEDLLTLLITIQVQLKISILKYIMTSLQIPFMRNLFVYLLSFLLFCLSLFSLKDSNLKPFRIANLIDLIIMYSILHSLFNLYELLYILSIIQKMRCWKY